MQPTTSPPLADPQEVFLREDCQATAHLPTGMPVCRFERWEDPGDPDHGILPFGGWQLSHDQAGTLLCMAIAQQETLALSEQPHAEADRLTEVVAAAHAVVERWDTPLWKDVPATAQFINRLRAALLQ